MCSNDNVQGLLLSKIVPHKSVRFHLSHQNNEEVLKMAAEIPEEQRTRRAGTDKFMPSFSSARTYSIFRTTFTGWLINSQRTKVQGHVRTLKGQKVNEF